MIGGWTKTLLEVELFFGPIGLQYHIIRVLLSAPKCLTPKVGICLTSHNNKKLIIGQQEVKLCLRNIILMNGRI